MASKKINWNLANSISHRIAEKAFEHLVKPLDSLLVKYLPMLPAPKGE